ncbi:hypothetical protein KKC91_05500 [bacterium]|nr:hypothetical protein [bacterium]
MNKKASRYIETILIFLAIFSVWPAIFRIDNIYFKVVMYVFLVIMAIIFFKRIRRIRTYMKDYSDFKKKKVRHSEKSD